VLTTTLKTGESAEYAPDKKRSLYLVPSAGAVEVNGVRVNAPDGVAIRARVKLKITALQDPKWFWWTLRNSNVRERPATSCMDERERWFGALHHSRTHSAYKRQETSMTKLLVL
jgi:hypothetical protein